MLRTPCAWTGFRRSIGTSPTAFTTSTPRYISLNRGLPNFEANLSVGKISSSPTVRSCKRARAASNSLVCRSSNSSEPPRFLPIATIPPSCFPEAR
jgi:hypothetical protein